MFEGHQFVKLISDDWVLDLTEFTGYHVYTDKTGKVKTYTKAFVARLNNSRVEFDKYCGIPLKILREASSVIIKYCELGEDNLE